MAETTPQSLMARCCDDGTLRDRRNRRRYTFLLFLWAVVYIAGTFLIKFEYVPAGPLTWTCSIVPSVFALLAVFAYARFLREADEMLRAIEVQALVLAVSAGFVVWPAFRLLEIGGIAVSITRDIPLLTVIVFYMIGILLGRSRYQ